MQKHPVLLIFLLMLSIYMGTASGHLYSRDGTAMFFMASSLCRHGHFAVPQNINTGGGRLGRDGLYYSPYGIGQALVAVPLFMVGQWLTEHTEYRYMASFMTSFMNSFVSAATISLLLGFLLSLGYGRLPSVVTALSAGLATMLWPYSRFFFSEPLVTLCQFAALYSLFLSIKRVERANQYLLLAGFLFGFAILTRPITILFCPALLLFYFLETGHQQRVLSWRQPGLFLGVVGLFCCIVGYYNWFRFGSPFDMGYVPLPDGSLQRFDFPFFKGLAVLLVSPGKSLFLYSPVLLMALTGLPALSRRFRPLSLFILVQVISYVLVYARWCQIEGGYTWGPRFLVPIVPLLVFPLVEILASKRARSFFTTSVIAGVIVVSFFVQTLAILVNYTEVIEVTKEDYYDQTTGKYNYFYNPIPGHIRLLLDHVMDRKQRSAIFSRPPQLRKQLYVINLDWSDSMDIWFLNLMEDGMNPLILLISLVLAGAVGVSAGWGLWKWSSAKNRSDHTSG